MRHIGPRAAVWPTSPAVNIALLGRTDLVSRPLPLSNVPTSPDAAAWAWTGRLDDAGEAQVTFPNREASDGMPWRQRFDPTGHLQFLEFYENGKLDSIVCLDTVNCSPQAVAVHGQDSWFLCKKAYERDWTVTHAPRDVIERATQVNLAITTDAFPAGSLNPQWTFSQANGGSMAIGASGGLLLTVPTTSGSQPSAQVATSAITLQNPTGVWSATATVQWTSAGAGATLGALFVYESDGTQININIQPGNATFFYGSGTQAAIQATIPTAVSYTLLIESDGAWVRAFVNGQFIGEMRRNSVVTTTLKTVLFIENPSAGGPGATSSWSAVLTQAMQPFLMLGSDKGDFVLPGTQTTYPSGGLSARYFNDADLQNDAFRASKVLGPSRALAFNGGGAAEYADQQDPQINGQPNPSTGAGGSGWSCIWYGAIYLKLSAGNYSFQVNVPTGPNGTGLRVWIGKTLWGTQLVDQKGPNNVTTSYPFTLTASTLAGFLPYGGGTVQRDGWYPIKVEYWVDGNAGTFSLTAPTFLLTSSPTAYTDPGGTSIASGSQSTVVPASSLSPLGCVDERFQGISHFDLAQQTVTGYGYQASVEPYRFETLNLNNQLGYFPGQLAPRIREGHDTDMILKPNTGPRTDGEGIINYSNTIDATDSCASLTGNGAGLQNGTTGSLQATVFDPATLLGSLFATQGWQDFSDASVPGNLQGLLNSELGLRLGPWQALSADPKGSARLAFTWPLPGAIAAMRWRPGDGLRVRARDINIYDKTPRQMLVVVRSVVPGGITGTTATFTNRPLNAARSLNRGFYRITRQQRNYQKQITTLTGTLETAANLTAGSPGQIDPGSSQVALQPGDQSIRAYVRIIAISGTAPKVGIVVNALDQTGVLNGPWGALLPLLIPLNRGAVSATSNNISVQVRNYSTVNVLTSVTYQVFVDVQR